MQISLLGTDAKTGSNTNVPEPRLVRAAREFEGQMMKELLKPLTDSDGLTGTEAEGSMGSGGVLGEFAGEALGRALSQQGGFGIADRIVAELSQSGHAAQWRKSNHECAR